MQDWTTITIHKNTVNQILHQLGLQDLECEELCSLDNSELLEQISPIHGLMFIYQTKSKINQKESLKIFDKELFFSNQVISNACLTQSLLQVLLNQSNVQLNDSLCEFRKLTQELDSQMKGLSISNFDYLKKIHNSVDKENRTKTNGYCEQVNYHFISYVVFKNKLYELDGLKDGPIILGTIDNNRWLHIAQKEIGKRINTFMQDQNPFWLFAVVQNHSVRIQKQIEQNLNEIGYFQNQASQNGYQSLEKQINLYLEGQEYSNNSKQGIEVKEKEVISEQFRQRCEIITKLKKEQTNYEKRKQMLEKIKKEKKFNYVPFIMELLKLSQQKGLLKSSK